ncbi:hypothetical protein DL767_003853 [Monosporascus sp. MG133]|nr:hypothetical protein DL767_003853 [Monosporascus sp. MG133]
MAPVPADAEDAAVDGLPWWEAPVPFRGIHNKARKPVCGSKQAADLISELRKLCKSGGKGRPPRGYYARPTRLPLVLNLFNARDPAALRGPWAYFHEEVLAVPHNPPRNFDWRLLRVARPKKSLSYSDNFGRDLARDWPSVTAAPGGKERPKKSDIKYRLLCFVHRHEDPDSEDFYDRVYSMSVYDRETKELAWHDPSRYRRNERRQDINRFWANIVHDFPIAFPQQPIHVPYYGLQQLSGFLHWTLDQFSARSPSSHWDRPRLIRRGIALWLMANINTAPSLQAAHVGPRPPDTIQTASGASDDQAGIPALIEALWLAIRENGEAGICPEARGNSHTTRKFVREEFGMPQGRNPWLRRVVHRRLRLLYPEDPDEGDSSRYERWIPRSFMDRGIRPR